jgi:hypothetical protein
MVPTSGFVQWGWHVLDNGQRPLLELDPNVKSLSLSLMVEFNPNVNLSPPVKGG